LLQWDQLAQNEPKCLPPLVNLLIAATIKAYGARIGEGAYTRKPPFWIVLDGLSYDCYFQTVTFKVFHCMGVYEARAVIRDRQICKEF